MADDRYIQDLLKDLRENPDWDIRSSAAQTLGDIVFEENQAPVVVNALTAALNDSNDNVRIWTVVALGDLAERNIDISSALPAIEKALDDEEEDVIYNAVEFFKAYDLAKLPLRNRFNIKLKISDSEEAIEDIISIGKPAIPALRDALKDGNSDVRWWAAEALGKIGDARAVPALRDALKDEDWDVREKAAEALGETAKKTADKGDYYTSLEIIRALTLHIIKEYGGKRNRNSLKGRRNQLKPLAELTEKIYAKMNPLDKKEPMKWQKPIAKAPAKKVNKRVLAK